MNSRLLNIGGVSRSGKTTLAHQLAERLDSQGHSCLLLHQDAYVAPKENLPVIRDHLDWEDPASIDWPGWELAKRKARAQSPWVIAEGLFALQNLDWEDSNQQAIFVKIDRATFYQRKDQDLRWGQEPDWYIDHIWNSFLRHGQPDWSDFSGIVISGTGPWSGEELDKLLI